MTTSTATTTTTATTSLPILEFVTLKNGGTQQIWKDQEENAFVEICNDNAQIKLTQEVFERWHIPADRQSELLKFEQRIFQFPLSEGKKGQWVVMTSNNEPIVFLLCDNENGWFICNVRHVDISITQDPQVKTLVFTVTYRHPRHHEKTFRIVTTIAYPSMEEYMRNLSYYRLLM